MFEYIQPFECFFPVDDAQRHRRNFDNSRFYKVNVTQDKCITIQEHNVRLVKHVYKPQTFTSLHNHFFSISSKK